MTKETNEYHLLPDTLWKIQHKYPDKIPLLLQCSDSKREDKPQKFLVPRDYAVSSLLYMFRKRQKLNPTQALFLLVGNEILPTSSNLSEVYARYKGEDGLLRITYSYENAFG